MKHIYSVRKGSSQLVLCPHVSYGPCVPIGARRYMSLVEKADGHTMRSDITCSSCPETFVVWSPTSKEDKS